MNHFTCPRCVRHDDTWPHACRVYDVACNHCGQPMAGYARQIMDAAEAHSRQCPGLLRPTPQNYVPEATKCVSTSADKVELGQEIDGPGRAGNTAGNLAHQPSTPEGGWHQ